MYESLIKPHEVSAIPPLSSVTDAAARLKAQDVRKEEKRIFQIAASRTRNGLKNADSDGKRKRDEVEADDAVGVTEESSENLDAKKIKIEAEEDDESNAPADQTTKASDSNKGRWKPVPLGEPRLVLSKPFAEVRGHTSYLTFALLVPFSVRTESASSSDVHGLVVAADSV
jgi:tRNA (adenine57-N1/adenine58-N1)-methyltransferase